MDTRRHLQTILVLLAMFSLFSSILAGPTPVPEPPTGIEGVISISPIHGGPIHEGVSSSKGLPNTEFVVQNEKGTVTSFTTDDQGKFRVSLPAGHYTVSLKTGRRAIGKFGPFEADVAAGKMTQVNWECDTGMR